MGERMAALKSACGGRLSTSETMAIRVLTIPEILVYIIENNIAETGDLKSTGARQTRIMKAQDTPWPYMLVCKAWFKILSSTPSLWKTFFVFCDGRYSEISHLPGMFELCLRYSKNLPLTLYISVTFSTAIKKDDAKSHALFMNLLSRVYEVQHRWGRCPIVHGVLWIPRAIDHWPDSQPEGLISRYQRRDEAEEVEHRHARGLTSTFCQRQRSESCAL